ncbi:MAG: 23S rRNA (guanosine(2251)-2'-O)-methyltransferase RlmB [Terrimonas sp.]|nr:23S rRNA (guanosine(2251)-2'-O)-methyltransferase RlmB [Terrimonas sp.]
MEGYHKKPRPKKSALVSGRQPLVEALRGGKPIDKILMQKGASGEAITIIRQLATERNIPVQYVPIEKLNAVSRGNHQGVIAYTAAIQYQELQQVISFVIEKGETPLFLILDSITDVRNIGAIARSALCLGVQALIIPDKGVAPLQEDAIKSSAGALENILVCRVNSLMKAVDELHLNGIRVFASEMTASNLLSACDFTLPCAIIMGNEEKGVYPALLKIADEQFKIPMTGDFESLNVSVATGIILYEVQKQRSDTTLP